MLEEHDLGKDLAMDFMDNTTYPGRDSTEWRQ
jgi:hypothetical protein